MHLFFFVLISWALFCLPFGAIPSDERDVLIQIYNDCQGPSWVDNQKWLSPEDPCSWFGVFCLDDHVNGLVLGHNNLEPTNSTTKCLPSEIGLLSYTEILVVPYNRVELPPEIGNLLSLLALEVFGNGISSLPTEIGDLTNLTKLFVAHNLIQDIPTEIGFLTKLVFFDASFNEIIFIPTQIGLLESLTNLDFSSNHIIKLPAELSLLHSLESLTLDDCNIQFVPPFFANLPNLTSLSLHQNALEEIPSEIGFLLSLTTLSLSNNFIAHIPTEIGNLQNLLSISAATNHLVAIPSELGNCALLFFIELSSNRLTNIPTELFQLSNLSILDLGENLIFSIAPQIENLTQLNYLNLGFNHIIDLPTTIGNLPSLNSLALQLNGLSSLPTEIGLLHSLNFLDCSVNSLTEIPSQVGTMTKLSTINLSYNLLETLPEEFSSLQLLNALILRSNKLRVLPSEVSSFTLLVVLDLSSNLLSTLSSNLTQISSLNVLDVSNNQLNDQQSLEVLAVVARQMMEGRLPGSTPFLDFSNNLLWGNLPQALCELDQSISTVYGTLNDFTQCPCIFSTSSFEPCVERPNLLAYDPVVPTFPPSPSSFEGVQSSTWVEKWAYFLGTRLNILEVETAFEKTPSFIESVACREETCSLRNPSCDYTQPSPNLDGCVRLDVPSNETWILLPEEGLVIRNQALNYLQNFRFYNPHPCKMVVIRVTPIAGDPDLYFRYSGPITRLSDYDIQGTYDGWDQIVLCPADPSFRPGTFFVSVLARNGISSYNISYRLLTHPKVPGGQEWISFDSDNRHSLTIASSASYPGCFVHIQASGGTGILSATINLQSVGSTEDKLVEIFSTDTPYSGVSSIRISSCDYEAFRIRALYSLTQPAFSQIFITTQAHFDLVPVTSLYAQDAMNRLQNSNSISLGGEDELSFLPIWSGWSDNAFLPPPEEIFIGPLLSLEYHEREWTAPETPDEGAERTIFTYLLCLTDQGGLCQFESKSPCLTFGVNLVNEDGYFLHDPFLTDPICPTPLTVSCDSSKMNDLIDLLTDQIDDLLAFSTVGVVDPTSIFPSLIQVDATQYVTVWSGCLRQLESYFQQVLLDFDEIPQAEEGNNISSCRIIPHETPTYYYNNTNVVPVFEQIRLNGSDNCNLSDDCKDALLGDYRIDYNYLSLGRCQPSSNPALDVIWYKKCKDEYFNLERNKAGRKCETDDDCRIEVCDDPQMNEFCDFVFQNSTNEPRHPTCNMIRGICNYSYSVTENLFFVCAVLAMPQDVKGYLVSLVSVDLNENVTALSLSQAFSLISQEDCVSDEGFDTFRNHFSLFYVFREDEGSKWCGCSSALDGFSAICLDQIDCNLPFRCESEIYRFQPGLMDSEEYCHESLIEQVPAPPPSKCQEEKHCNWNFISSGSFVDDLFCQRPDFCGVRVGYHEIYVDLELSEKECLDGHICVTPWGAIISNGATMTEADCVELGRCTGDCWNEQIECEPVDFRTPAICYSTNFSSESCGEFHAGIFDDGVCLFPQYASEDECAHQGYLFVQCKGMDPSNNCSTGLEHFIQCIPSMVGECSREECVPPNGWCDNSLVFINHLTRPAALGMCVFPFQDIGNGPFCPAYSPVSSLGCGNPNVLSWEECLANGGEWANASFTESECNSYGKGCFTRKTIQTGLLELISEEDCTTCGGVIKDLFQWEDAKWIPGKLMKTEWVKSKVIPSHFSSYSVNFSKIDAIARAPWDNNILNSFLNQALCTSSVLSIDTLDFMSCECDSLEFNGSWALSPDEDEVYVPPNSLTEEKADESSCGPNQMNCSSFITDIATLSVCENDVTRIVSSLTNIFFDHSVNQLPCVTVRVSVENPQALEKTNSIALSFVEIQIVTNSYATVINKHDQFVGQVMSSTIIVSISNLIKSVELAQICIREDPSLNQNDPHYTVYDLGKRRDDGFFVPLNLPAMPEIDSLENREICFPSLNITTEDPVCEVAVILREKDYENVQQLTHAEKSLFFTSGALYSFGCLFVFLITVSLRTLNIFVILLQFFLLLLVRGIYFFLLAFEVMPTSDHTLLDYALVEVPSFLYIGVFAQILITIGFVSHYDLSKVPREKVWIVILSLLLLVWVSFAVVLVVMSHSSTTGKVSCTCNCRLCTNSSPGDSARIIRIVYKSIVVALALGVVVGFKWLEHRFFHSTQLWYTLLKGISFCLFLNSVAFLIYYAVDDPSPYFSISLWFTELVPVCVLSYFFIPESLRVYLRICSSRLRKTTPFVERD